MDDAPARRRLASIASSVASGAPFAPSAAAAPAPSKAALLALRKKHFCDAQSISYENTAPLLLVRGEGCRLYDEHGTAYLDTRNNVAHLGHCHAAVVEAVRVQVGEINTNTRYLHPNVVTLAAELSATMPRSPRGREHDLSKVLFVNSGSEANDLALRLARAHTGGDEHIVVERAYHGHTVAAVGISPYKFEHKGGEGRPPSTHVVPCPDTFRGAFRDEATAGALYADHVARACEAAAARRQHAERTLTAGGVASGGGVSAFFVESGMSVAGVILPPPGYLARCYEAVRAAGGVCVADEVQTGLGRFGEHFWGFQQQGVVPDIVTVGKPFGNGMPLACVITTPAIAASFTNGLEYFNTFGGNPVCAAAGLAVLRTIAAEDLQGRARRTGEYLRRRIGEMSSRFPLLGDVRGAGLFLGIEFVQPGSARPQAPAAAECSVVCSWLKDEHRILTSIDGAHDNVIVLKPPMVFGEAEADELCNALESVLSQLGEIDASSVSHTPT